MGRPDGDTTMTARRLVRPLGRHLPSRLAAAAALLAATAATAQTAPPTDPGPGRSGKLALTGGVSTIDGAAGGGLTPWAVTGTLATEGQIGASAFVSRVRTRDYGMSVMGAALGLGERAEISLARQDFDTGMTGTALGLPGLRLKQDIVGVKLRVAGDAVLDSDRAMPQVAVGLLSKRTDAGGLAPTLAALGADTRGTEFYVSATKLLLAQGVLLNGTLRVTKANQNGLLCFGGTGRDSASVNPEFSAAWLLSPRLAVGAEFRVKPDNLNPSPLGAGLKEDDWRDLFIAWAPHKQLSITAAWVDLGRIVPAVATERQRGAYLSLQAAF